MSAVVVSVMLVPSRRLRDLPSNRAVAAQGYCSSAGTPFPDMFLIAVSGGDPVFHLKGAVFRECLLNGVPDGLPVVGMNQFGKRVSLVSDQLTRRVAGQLFAALADKLHGPVSVVGAAVGNAGQIGK